MFVLHKGCWCKEYSNFIESEVTLIDVCQGRETKMVRQLFIWYWSGKERCWKLSILWSQVQVHLMRESCFMLPFALMVYASLSTSFNFLFFPWCIFMNGHGKLAVTGPKSNFQLYWAIILLCMLHTAKSLPAAKHGAKVISWMTT